MWQRRVPFYHTIFTRAFHYLAKMKSAKPITPMGESLFIRILLALPLLGLFFIARTVLTTNISKCMPLFEEAMKIKFINDTGRQVPLRKTYSGLEGLDGFLGIFVAFFTPALAGLDQSKNYHNCFQCKSLTDFQQRQHLAPILANMASYTPRKGFNLSHS